MNALSLALIEGREEEGIRR
jgi:hypothetical protein